MASLFCQSLIGIVVYNRFINYGKKQIAVDYRGDDAYKKSQNIKQMKKVIFSTNLPSPYRVDFFNELGKYCDLTVVYERQSSSERNAAWIGCEAYNFKEVYLDLELVGVDQSKGSALRKYIKDNNSDILVFTNYVSPAVMEAIIWCRFHGREYYMEYDGGFNKKDSAHKRILKQFLLKGAKGHLTTADEHIRYLISLGIKENTIHKYPFTSISEEDILAANRLTADKQFYKDKLGIKEEKVILSVGRFSYNKGYGKGFDILMRVAPSLPTNVGIYIVGDEPTKEFLKWKNDGNLQHVHFIGFKDKNSLAEYYAAADIFTILTRGDVWGLVVNEAMAYGLPVVASNRCIAALEMVKDGENGYIVDINNLNKLSTIYTNLLLDLDLQKRMSENSLRIVGFHTRKCMVDRHLDVWNLTR